MFSNSQCSVCSLPPEQSQDINNRLQGGATSTTIAKELGCSEAAIRRHRSNHLDGTNEKQMYGAFIELLQRQGISIEDIGSVEKIKAWQGFYKDKDGEAHTVDQVGIVISPSWENGPEWPVVQRSQPVSVRGPRPRLLPVTDGWKTAVILPDIQAGYFLDLENNLHPTHDEAAVDVALQIVAAENPDVVVMVGDGMDFPEFSTKYRLSPAFERTTTPTIDWVTSFVAKLRWAAPEALIVWLAGNHEERLPNYLLDNARAAFGIRRGNAPKEWPVLSVPFLCRFDDYGVNYLPGYPANEFYINDRIKVIHGSKVNSNGSTVHRYLDTERVSTISGHIHRREMGHRTRRTRDGPRTIMAASPGCLCKTTGQVPSVKGGLDLFGVPIETAEDWTQGLAVVRYEEGDGRFVYSDIGIFDGWALWRDREFVAENA